MGQKDSFQDVCFEESPRRESARTPIAFENYLKMKFDNKTGLYCESLRHKTQMSPAGAEEPAGFVL